VPVLANNLDNLRHSVWTAWPGTVVGWIGDSAHQSECSDHNPDGCGIVHAVDVMWSAGTEQANAVVNATVGRPDLQYVIHNRTIWSASWGWGPREYTGSDPHTNHVHVSGKHGSDCSGSMTCTGYDKRAEASDTPWNLALPIGPTPNPNPPPPAGLDEDGVIGPMTVRAWQKRMGTPQDGVISSGYSNLVAAVQVYLNRKVNAGLSVDGVGIRQDGHTVYQTQRALQRYLGTPADGVLSLPSSACVKALQHRLNAGTF